MLPIYIYSEGRGKLGTSRAEILEFNGGKMPGLSTDGSNFSIVVSGDDGFITLLGIDDTR